MFVASRGNSRAGPAPLCRFDDTEIFKEWITGHEPHTGQHADSVDNAIRPSIIRSEDAAGRMPMPALIEFSRGISRQTMAQIT
jgi:hypothetical protein